MREALGAATTQRPGTQRTPQEVVFPHPRGPRRLALAATTVRWRGCAGGPSGSFDYSYVHSLGIPSYL